MPLKLTRIKRSPHWYLRGTVRGQTVFETTQTADRHAADAIRIQRENELLDRSIFGPASTVTFREAAIVYCESKRPGGTQRDMILGRDRRDGSRSWNLIDAIGDMKLAVIDQTVIDDIARRRFAAAAPATIQRQLITPVSAILHSAQRRGWCTKPGFEHPSIPRGRVRWLTPGEFTALSLAAAKHLRPLLVFLVCTGARLSEALELQWRDVDLQDAQCWFWDTKSGQPRRALLPPAAVVALANLKHRNGAVFRRPGGRDAYASRAWRGGGQIKTSFSGAVRRAGIAPVTPHGLRHTWASWFYASSKDILLLKAEGGWASVSQVERYAHLVPSRIVPDIRAVWGGDHPALSPSATPRERLADDR